jgi:hypothetical protein
VLNQLLLDLAKWIGTQSWSIDLHESYYMYNWLESSHVMTLMLSLGMLFLIDLRMLGLCLTNVPASKIAERLDKPMMIGFVLMFITGIVLYVGIPVRTTQSLWFRIKMILLVAAAINAWLFRKKMATAGSWDSERVAPKRMRIGAGLSLALWSGVVVCGRFIAYDWFDCGSAANSAFVNWAAGCLAQ